MQQNETRYAPIVMFVYNRADHFEQTYEALTKCPEAKDSILYIFSDGPKSEAGAEKVREVRSAVHSHIGSSDFREIIVKENPVNRGLADSIISGVTSVMEKHGRAIIIEDDNLCSPYYLHYMNKCLDYYQNDKSIGALAGFTPMLKELDNYPHDVFLAYRSCSCSWASWKDRWDNVDWKLEHFHELAGSLDMVRKLNANGNDRFIRLYRQSKGIGNSWSVRFGAHLVRNGMYTVYPRYSYISNIGCDETGVHSQKKDAETMKCNLSYAKSEAVLECLQLDPHLQKAMKKHYSGGFVSDIKRSLATTAIVIKERLCKH